MTHRFREQARSHRGWCTQLNLGNASTPASTLAHSDIPPARHVFQCTDGTANTKPVGAGLLAKAFCQSTSPLNDPPLSRARSLPQGLVYTVKFGQCFNSRQYARTFGYSSSDIVFQCTDATAHAKPVGAGLLAKAFRQATSSLNDTPLSRAGSLPQGLVYTVKFGQCINSRQYARTFGYSSSETVSSNAWMAQLTPNLWERACSRRLSVSQHHR